MENPVEPFWRIRLENCKKALEKNNFDVFVAEDAPMAKQIVLEDILPELVVKSASWGDSMTLAETRILDHIRQMPGIRLIQTFDDTVSRKEILERRRQALLTDLFFTGTNAVTQTGKLVNLDMVGNRVGGIVFGPLNVVLLVGRNKMVPDVAAAMDRIRQVAAPANAIRHPGLKTPCMKTAQCMDCKSPDRICNTWTITEKSYPAGRIKVVLINRDLGL